MKKTTMLIFVLLTAALAFAFAGCGETDTDSNAGGETEAYVDEETGADMDADEGLDEDYEGISFETIDLDGNAVSAADLFDDNDVTMLNIWGTFCPPCIEEMPELEKINQEYANQGAAVIGLVCDVTAEDDSCLQDAFDIIDDAGVTYRNLYWCDEMDEQLATDAVPTTFFVDSDGNLLGDPIVGASPDEYRSALDQYLAETD